MNKWRRIHKQTQRRYLARRRKTFAALQGCALAALAAAAYAQVQAIRSQTGMMGAVKTAAIAMVGINLANAAKGIKEKFKP